MGPARVRSAPSALGAEPVEHGGGAVVEAGHGRPAENLSGIARIQRRSGQLTLAGRSMGRRAVDGGGRRHGLVEAIDRGLDTGPDVAQDPVTPTGGPDERVDDVVDEHEVTRLLAVAEDR